MNNKALDWQLERLHPPENFSVYLKCLWWDKKGSWEQAHDAIQDMAGKEAAWIHAYLHRKEGDIGNAAYWYRQAGKTSPDYGWEEEWNVLADYFLSSTS